MSCNRWWHWRHAALCRQHLSVKRAIIARSKFVERPSSRTYTHCSPQRHRSTRWGETAALAVARETGGGGAGAGIDPATGAGAADRGAATAAAAPAVSAATSAPARESAAATAAAAVLVTGAAIAVAAAHGSGAAGTSSHRQQGLRKAPRRWRQQQRRLQQALLGKQRKTKRLHAWPSCRHGGSSRAYQQSRHSRQLRRQRRHCRSLQRRPHHSLRSRRCRSSRRAC